MRPFSTEQLCLLAEAYCAATGVAPSGLSAKITDDRNHKLMHRLIAGYGCTLENAERASEWFAENWPTDVPWPKHVPLPKEAA
jgi:hypothetical protein